jgi:hypothetical protein
MSEAATKDLLSSPAVSEYPMTVREAAKFLGVSQQTVYLLGGAKADSPSPRYGPKHPVLEIGSRVLPRVVQTGDGECLGDEITTVVCTEERRRKSGGYTIAIGTESVEANPLELKTGRKPKRDYENGSMPEITTF